MVVIKNLIAFEDEAGNRFFSNVESLETARGTSVKAFASFDDLTKDENGKNATVAKLLPPLPDINLPIYCVGLNYGSHAKEAKLNVPANPPVWTKPSAALASPGSSIPMSRFCASHLPDWEGELVFVTSREVRDVSPETASSCILGYTIGNDISCRFFQLPEQSGGQFFYAKAFDKFAPIGPVLVSPASFENMKSARLITRINGEVKQNTVIEEDMIFNPARVLSWMSQSTTIPAYTAVMTGTPSGVGAFQTPRQFLKNGDVVEIEICGIGILRNDILFEDGQDSMM
ncbi:hypothetical protein PENANT_c003G03990 [Penicillium antarcticum]|uniref:Fumarylacetoacetase-like C-terminal domain-containing protein n=1 Tax=Penicillium antarcticum TaxID=416450 RepID=A0A1V6QI95_9EURO|nr:uncharacterized protein N7508_006082 [Penicillium antarcticum]KAJ5307067.1 hypothetical protein N7508_006082 [Penicillium antarcticum]OQD88940.1 hypothetical protein PENANT_c003G03990 [Penicillium antarcticum]